jgi:hypothetical protein
MAVRKKAAKQAKPRRAVTRQKQSPTAVRPRDPRKLLRAYGRAARSLEKMGKRALSTGNQDDLRDLVECLTDFRKEVEWLPKMVATKAEAERVVTEAFAKGWRLDDPPKGTKVR